MFRSVVKGCGAYLPAKTLTNNDMAKLVDTSDEWIVQRTGIRERHIAAEGEKTSDLGLVAARRALESAGMDASEIDLIVFATSTPDQTFPATAVRVQQALGAGPGAAFDVQAVCSGFVYALAIADNFLRVGQAKKALVIGAETFSRILDWEDRGTCVLFGDGAGAVVLERQTEAEAGDRGIISTHLHSDGRFQDILYVDGGPSSTGTVGKLRMNGKEVFKQAVQLLAEVVVETLEANKLAPGDIDWLVPHQANQRIIDSTARKLNLSSEKVVSTIALHGNTSAASIPLALAEAVNDGRIKKGDLVLTEAMGGGLTWGAALIRW
ncbi:MAG TPA: beta-ketoacyl-ACP synthase III [Alphaproteobacteria bacterium]|jgi:3-oxoacyl-[acyl-carrier-protein] synthase-3|nr:beta-ketoacyl-ACP synthase III [Alphaproteobacteria bacterium]